VIRDSLLLHPHMNMNLDFFPDDGATRLHQAASNGRAAAVKLLIERGANVLVRSNDGVTPLHDAARFEAEWDGEDGEERQAERVAVARMLLDKGADILATTNRGLTPLHFAAYCGDMVLVQILLERGAVVSARDSAGRSPLHMAAFKGRHQVARLLLDKGGDVLDKCFDGEACGHTLLHAAANADHANIQLFTMLVERGSDVTAQAEDGQTPLHIVAAAEAFEHENGAVDGLMARLEALAILLIQHGADMSVKDARGNTPLHLSLQQQGGDDAAAQKVTLVLIARGADLSDGDALLRLAVWFGADVDNVPAGERLVRLLLDKGARFPAKAGDQETALHWSADVGSEANVRLLVQHGWDVSGKDGRGATPLHVAAREGREDMTQVLIELGADVTAQDKDGFSPLHAAVERYGEGVVEILLDNGADFEARSNDGRTPEDVATANSCVEIVAMLQAKAAQAKAAHTAKVMAFAMGHQERLGAGSRVRWLDAGVVRMVVEYM